MEDIKRRLEYKNRTVQLQVVEKLFHNVKKKIPSCQQLSSSVPESPELKLLWQNTGSDQGFMAQRCCQVLIQLLKDGLADFTYIMNSFLNQVPSAKNLKGIIEALSEMLVLQVLLVHTKGDEYKCPYSIRHPPHPFVTLMTNRPSESWPLIVEQIDRLFSHSDACVRSSVLKMMDPLLRYIWLDPNSNEQFWRIRSVFRVKLVELANGSEDRQQRDMLLHYLLGLMCNMQIKTIEDVAEIGQFCVQLLGLYGNHVDDLDVELGERTVTYALELCQIHQQWQADAFSIIRSLEKLCLAQPMILCNDVNICMLGELLLNSSYNDCLSFLKIAKDLLQNGKNRVSPICSGYVAMATINVLATPSSGVVGANYKMLTSFAVDVLDLIEEYPLSCNIQTFDKSNDCTFMTGSTYSIQACKLLATKFSSDVDSLIRWLKTVDTHIKQMKVVPLCFVNLLVSVLLKHHDSGICSIVMERLSNVVKADPAKGLFLLPVYLYKLRKTQCPSQRLCVIEALPKLATHKYNVAPVLKTIQGLSTCAKMKSLSLKLLTDVWVLQDRCFPQLLKAITESNKSLVTMATVTDDITLSKARAIKEVCCLRPEQHGAEMLAPLSDILAASKNEQSGLVAALCLEALYHICKAEVIDIMSAWSVLESQLISDTRIVVIVKICELFSLVPSLQVRSPEFEVFHSESARHLWLYTQHNSDVVVSAAYSALSKYDRNLFRISHFKYQIVKEFVEQAEVILAQDENNEGTVDTVIPYVPGICYMRLLENLTDKALEGYGEFLNAITGQEVSSLPRGIYFTSLQQHRSKSSQGKEIEQIPKFIQSQYENTKQPGLRPGLAAAVLLSYDPILEVGRDGRPRKHYVMSHGKNYQQMFSALLQDVPVQPSDWYRTSLMGRAWETFVQKMFVAMLQARQTEVDLQLSRDYLDEKEANDKKAAAWLLGSPSEQFNCILALSGLVKATHKFYASLDPEEKKQNDGITEHMSHSHWLLTVIDTCMSLVDFTHVPLSSLLGFCQQRSVDERLPASILAQAAAVLTICQMTSIVVGSHKDLVYKLMDMLIKWLPWQQNEDECPPVLFFFRGLGLGVMIEKLILGNFADIEGMKGSLALWNAIQKLEECTISGSEHRTGSVLGLSLCFGALCKDGQTESRAHMNSFHPKLAELITKIDKQDVVFQPMCLCLSSLTGCGFVANILPLEIFDATLTLLKSQLLQQMNVGLTRSIGFLCYAGESGAHPAIGQIKDELFADWLKVSTNQESSEMEKIAALTGIMSLIGSDASMLHTDTNHTVDVRKITGVVKQMKEITIQCDTIGIKNMTSWLLGNLYFSRTDTGVSSSSSPASYSYLQESSVLRANIDFLILAGKQGPEFIPSSQVKACLQSLQREVTGTLPPLNWMSVLSPLMKLPFDECVRYEILQLAVKVSLTSTSAAQFLAAWIVPPLFNSLEIKCQSLILSSCANYMQCVTPSVLQTFLEKSFMPIFGSQERQLRTAALRGLNSSLVLRDPPQSTVSLLHKAVEGVFESLEEEENFAVLSYLSECLSHVPDAVLDKLTSDDCKDKNSIHRGTLIRCFLVGNGHQPLPLLNSCIDAALNNPCNTDQLLWYITHSFHKLTQLDASKSPILQRVQWLIEITGHCRNIATKTFKLNKEDVDMTVIMKFMVNIIAAAVCMWTGRPTNNLLMGMNSIIMSKPIADWSITEYETNKEFSDWVTSIRPLDCLTACVQSMTSEPWVQILPKVIEWILSLLECPDSVCTQDVKLKLARCLQTLRASQEYRKIPVWTVAVFHTH